MIQDSQNYKDLKEQLREMFQLNQADLDFGIYRIMNHKRHEVEDFLEKGLLPQVRSILKENQPNDKTAIQSEITKLENNLRDAGIDPETSPKVQELKQKLSQGFDISTLESEIYSDLYNFFRRYYNEGDFMSMRRYKDGVYAIPYAGEEVKLHWANHDQYYIKTSENFQNYAFKIEGKSFRFELISAHTERNNNKAQSDKQRRFALAEQKTITKLDDNGDEYTEIITPVSVSDTGEVMIKFTYDFSDSKQDDLNQSAQDILKNNTEYADALSPLWELDKDKNRIFFAKHITDYTAKNSFDYFIHKDLGKFLRQELDFYIKNEIMHLDDIEHQTADYVNGYLSKIRAMRQVAGKIITFLASLEDFQKKLWLKKKFVLETHYCITLDHIIKSPKADELLAVIASNKEQIDEWVKLFAIDEIKGDLEKIGFDSLRHCESVCNTAKQSSQTDASPSLHHGEAVIPAKVGIQNEIKRDSRLRGSDDALEKAIAFLRQNDKLLVDTKFFPLDFKYRLLSLFDNLDAQTNGVLMNSENFQALNLLQERYREKIKCIYIDPPYNTEKDREKGKFIYKDGYSHSSWLSLMNDRLNYSKNLLDDKGVIFESLDENEFSNQKSAINFFDYLGTIILQTATDNNPSQITIEHEYIMAFAKNKYALDKWVGKNENARLIQEKYSELLKKIGNDSAEIQKELRSWINKNKSLLDKVSHYDNVDEKGVFHDGDIANTKFGGYSYNIIHPTTKEICVIPEKGFRYPETTMQAMILNGEIQFGKDEKTLIKPKKRIQNVKDLLRSIIYEDGRSSTKMLENMFYRDVFSNPKSEKIIARILSFPTINQDIILDYFAGSGTTGHAVINLNREDNGSRQYILVEMGEYFNSVTKPRIQKAVYSKDWKNGKPVSRDGVSHLFKYMALEQYEDTLDNLGDKETGTFGRTKQQQDAFDNINKKDKDKKFYEGYMLSYMLDTESRGSQSLLNLDSFTNPFDYKMKITRNNSTHIIAVDVIETFNYLLGLTVQTVDRDKTGIITITGMNALGENCLIIWRNAEQITNNALNDWFKRRYSAKDFEFDAIYVNGDNNIENMKLQDDIWKVRLIEAEFKRLMFIEN